MVSGGRGGAASPPACPPSSRSRWRREARVPRPGRAVNEAAGLLRERRGGAGMAAAAAGRGRSKPAVAAGNGRPRLAFPPPLRPLRESGGSRPPAAGAASPSGRKAAAGLPARRPLSSRSGEAPRLSMSTRDAGSEGVALPRRGPFLCPLS